MFNTKKHLVAFAVLLTCVACLETDQSGGPSIINPMPAPEFFGGRFSDIDLELPRGRVSVYGSSMGTPDWEAVKDEVDRFKDRGDIVNIREIGVGGEHGATYCFEFSYEAEKEFVYQEFQRVYTDPQLTRYTVESVSSCFY